MNSLDTFLVLNMRYMRLTMPLDIPALKTLELDIEPTEKCVQRESATIEYTSTSNHNSGGIIIHM